MRVRSPREENLYLDVVGGVHCLFSSWGAAVHSSILQCVHTRKKQWGVDGGTILHLKFDLPPPRLLSQKHHNLILRLSSFLFQNDSARLLYTFQQIT